MNGWLKFLNPVGYKLHQNQLEILMKLSELVAIVTAANVTLSKISDETGSLIEKIDELEGRLEDIELPEDVQTALIALRANLESLDELVPDLIVVPVDDGTVKPSDPSDPEVPA